MRIEKRGVEALQYGPVMGITDLREVVVNDLLKPKGVKAKVENVFITGGGMEAINLLCQLYIDPGDIILVESPGFVHSVEVFEMFQAKCIPVDMDEKGMVTEDLEEKIIKYKPDIQF
ncbi:MAG: aminotransferase class I/II-fold pyridoxal phosphate-dependent enzyme [Sedimentibacter sp.]